MAFTPFIITKVEHHNKGALFDKLKTVSMLKKPEDCPYRTAQISLERMRFEDVLPAQRYVLKDGLHKAQQLEWELERHKINLFALDGYVTIWTDQSTDPIDVLPPIVESWTEANGEQVNIINDGMHRMYVARLEWKIPQVVFIQNVPTEFPYYAYPIPGAHCWDIVKVIEGETIPADILKKWHRIPDNKALYRNFNSSFQNVGGPRGQG